MAFSAAYKGSGFGGVNPVAPPALASTSAPSRWPRPPWVKVIAAKATDREATASPALAMRTKAGQMVVNMGCLITTSFASIPSQK